MAQVVSDAFSSARRKPHYLLDGPAAIGATSVTVRDGDLVLSANDMIRFYGRPGQFEVTQPHAGGPGDIDFTPQLPFPLADGSGMEVLGRAPRYVSYAIDIRYNDANNVANRWFWDLSQIAGATVTLRGWDDDVLIRELTKTGQGDEAVPGNDRMADRGEGFLELPWKVELQIDWGF